MSSIRQMLVKIGDQSD